MQGMALECRGRESDGNTGNLGGNATNEGNQGGNTRWKWKYSSRNNRIAKEMINSKIEEKSK